MVVAEFSSADENICMYCYAYPWMVSYYASSAPLVTVVPESLVAGRGADGGIRRMLVAKFVTCSTRVYMY